MTLHSDNFLLSQVVQRFSLHHRSLFPIMTAARSNFIFTSHVDQPLAVWDRSVNYHQMYLFGTNHIIYLCVYIGTIYVSIPVLFIITNISINLSLWSWSWSSYPLLFNLCQA